MLIPIEDFFRNSEQTGFQISPDGKYISFMAPYRDRMNIFVKQLQSNELRQLTWETERSIGGYMWANNERLLYVKDQGGDENYRLYGVNNDGTDMRCYTDFDGVRASLIDGLEDVPDEVIIGMNKRIPEVFDPYRLNLKTGEMQLLAENPGNIAGWMTDHEGKLRVATAIVDGVNTQILYRDTEDEPFRPVLTTNFRETLNFMDFAPDNRMVYAGSNLGRDKVALVLVNPATCQEVKELYAHEKYDINSIMYSKKRKKLLSVSVIGHACPERHYFDEEAETFYGNLKKRFPGYRVSLADCDRDETRFLLYVGSDRTRGAYYYYEPAANRLEKVAELAPWLSEDELVAMHPVTYRSRDGLTIEAYLSLPKGYDLETAKNLPVVINPHGGPWARDIWCFSSEVQFLCNRGYAVFQMNFRTSTGYGRKFLEAGFKQWGRAIQNDITDGANWLISQGIANPHRIAIYGGSFGGYAALAGVTFTPDLYACAVDYVGVSNLFTFMQTIPPYWKPMLEMLYEQVGHPEHDKEMLEACSPVFHADNIKAPLFIAQGANDPRVNKAESDQMVAALRQRGVEVEYMVKDNEGHGFSNQENRFDFYRHMEDFLKKHIGKEA